MKTQVSFGLIFCCWIFVGQASAQVAPLSAWKSSGKSSNESADLDSSRYQRRSKGASHPRPPASVLDSGEQKGMEPGEANNLETKPGTEPEVKKRISPTGPKTSSAGDSKTTKEPRPEPQATPSSMPVNLPEANVKSPLENKGTEGFLGQMRDTVMGGSAEEIESYRAQLHAQDIRGNLLEITFAPAFIYNDSKSPSWTRSYSNATPAAKLGADVWFSPFFGLHSDYMMTLGGAIGNNLRGDSAVPFTDDWLNLTFKFRRFFDSSSVGSAFSFGLGYRSYQRKLPPDETTRVGLVSRGIVASLEGMLPVSKKYAWVLGADFAPNLSHDEKSPSGATTSGSKNESVSVGATLGGQFFLNPTQRLIWQLNHTVERNVFTGSSSPADSVTGTNLQNVSVTNSLTVFQLGHVWGF